MTASRLAFHAQDVRTPPTMASGNHLGGASLDHLLAHLESSKQALEHQVQQLLHENRSSKFAKKEQQWQMEGKRFQSQLENMNMTLKEKEERICRLEKELRESRSSIQLVLSRCREAEKEKERSALERANLQADLEDAQASFQNLQREYKSKHDVAEKQRRALESLADKVEKQKEIFQNQLEDVRRRLVESEEREHKFGVAAQSARQEMAEKERQLKSLRDAHEKLVYVQRGKQAEEQKEVREVIQVLESTQEKCEEQKKLIKELEQELGKTRKEAHRLDARASVAEANASAKTGLLEKVQLELNNSSSHVDLLTKAKTHIEELKAQIETLKRSLQDVENALSEESALKFKAECAMDEYKIREKSLLKIEQEGKALKEEVKWKKEQFESLEEAHNRMRDQFHEGRNNWASEEAALLRVIEALTKDVQSRDTAVHDLRSQVNLLQQSLTHEENCRKLLEFQLTDAKAGMESVSAEFLSAQSILEFFREKSKTKLYHLKNALTDKDKQLKELHDKQRQIDRDQKSRLTELEGELDNYKSNCEHLQLALENRAEQEILAIEINRDDVLGSEEMDHLIRSLSDAESTIAAKEVEIKELKMELDRTHTLAELLRISLAKAEANCLEEKSSLEQTTASLSVKQLRVMELEIEMEKLRAVVNDYRECNTEAEAKVTLLEERLCDAQKELQDKNSLSNQTLLDVHEQEDDVLAVRSECESLRQQLHTCETEKRELKKYQENLPAESREKELVHQKEKEELLAKLEHLGKRCLMKENQLSDLLDQIERKKNVISTLEARCSTSEQELSKQLALVDHAREEVDVWKLNAQAYKERAQLLDTSLSPEAAAKDSSLQEIKDTLQELTREAKDSKAIIDDLNKNLKSAEEAAAARSEELHELRKELESKVIQLLSVAEQARALEDKLRETEAIVHDKEQRLAASEWTVQQLASEIAKSKNFLTQMEKDEVASKDRLSHVETHLKEKEREFMELHCDLENAVNTSNERYTAMQHLTCSMEELTHELDFTKRALKERTAALAASEAEVKGVLEVQKLTEEALATCKERLSNEVETNAARENDMKHLCEDMESAKLEFRLADAQVKDLQERLKCLERTTEARLESYERKMVKGATDLSEYKNNCAGLMELIEKKDVVIDDLESKVEHGRKELARQVTVTEQNEQELASVTQQLDTKTKMHSNLKVELATADDIIKELDLQKRGLEEELRELKTSLSVVTEDVKEKASELEQQKRAVERLESLAESHVVMVKELTSNAVEERDNKIARLQTALNKAHDDLQSAYALVSAKEGEKRTLSARLSEMDTVVEKSKSQVSQLQASLQLARANLEAETERVWQQVAARTEIETELDSWKAKAAVLTEKTTELESSMRRLQAEKAKAEALTKKTAELESSISKLLAEVKEWKEVAEHTENLSQMELEAWKARVASLTETNATIESSLEKSKVEVEEWKEIAENTQLLNAELEKSLHAVEDSVTGWEKVVTSVVEEGDVTKRHLEFVLKQVHEEFRCLQEDLANSKDLICSEGRVLKAEFVTFVTDSHKAEEAKSETLEVETREFESSAVTALQAEVEVWRQKAAEATEEGLQIKAQFEDLLKSLQGELKTWKQFETLAREERQSTKTETTPTRIEGDEPDVFTPMSINPFHQEDEGCSSGLENDDAAQQLNGWKSKSSAAAKEGRKLTRQFRASFKHLQFELESRKQAPPPRMARHESFVHRHNDTGLEDLVKALQEEAVEVKAELAEWKSKAISAATLKEDLEKMISKLNAEVEVWKDRAAMSAGQRIVARRQLDDYAKQVKSLNADLQKWKDVATEANEGSTKLQTSLETLQKEHEVVGAELNEWMQKALELNCRIKDLERDLENWKQKAEELEHEVEKWKTVAATAEEDGKSATMELLDTLGKFEDELEVMSSNSIGECSSVGGVSLREEDLDCTSTWQRSPSGRFSNEWRSELETSLQAEVEDWKKRAEKEQEEIRQRYETTVKELHSEVEAWKKSAEDRAESENKLKLGHATEVLSLQAELERWKASAADAAQECTSLHETAIKELHSELTQWKEKSETATKEANSVKSNLENVIQDMEHQVRKWKQKAERALEGVAKSQEYEDLIKALEEELCLWTQRVQEGNALQLELEKDRAQLRESLIATQSELQNWKDRVAAVLQEEEDNDDDVDTDLESELQKWKSKAIDRELLKDMLAETLTELQGWKHKAAELSLVAEALKEELIIVIEEGRLETEELSRSSGQLDAEPQERQSLQTELKDSHKQVREEKVA